MPVGRISRLLGSFPGPLEYLQGYLELRLEGRSDWQFPGRTRAPEKLETVGDHLRCRRLARKLIQRQVAEQIGVDKTSIHNWETNLSKPSIEYMPAIIKFLGYDPMPPPKGWADSLVQVEH